MRLDKRFVKEPMLDLMEDLRFFTRARPDVDVVWGIATSLYEWQLVRYSKQLEVRQQECFEMSKVYRLYWKEKQYTYADLDMKYLIAVVRELLSNLDNN